MNTRLIVQIAVPVASAAVAGVGTYLVMNKKLEQKYADYAEAEIEAARQMYKKRYKAGEFAELPKENKVEVVQEITQQSQEEMLAETIELLERNQYTHYRNPPAVVEGEKIEVAVPVQTEEERLEVTASMRRNIFDDHALVETDEFDPEREEAKKLAGKPYIVEHDEWYENENNNHQYTLDYYEEDDVLTDEKNRPIPRKESVIGEGNLRFGYGTTQKDVVLIHNPVLHNDYEVTRVNSSYSREILGFDAEDKEPKSLRKFRDDD